MQTKSGSVKTKQTMTKKLGGAKALKQHMHDIAVMGGSARVPKGFSMLTVEERREVGRKGGHNGSRKGIKNGQGKYRRKDNGDDMWEEIFSFQFDPPKKSWWRRLLNR